MIVKAEKFAQGGSSVAHLPDGKVVFVDGLFPGEEAVIDIVTEKKDYCLAKVLEVVSKSAARRPSPCPYSAQCGGCPWMELAYEDQIKAKEGILKELFSDFEYRSEKTETASEFGYRSRARFRYTIRDGKASLGFCSENSNDAVLISQCPIADKPLNSLIKDPPRLNAWELKNQELSCITTDDGVLYGDGIGHITIGGKTLPVSNKVFFQSNLLLLPKLIDYVKSNTVGPKVMDLYSGIGTFSAFLEDDFEVTAVEMNRHCLNLAERHLGRTRFFTSPVERWNPREKQVDTVIVDPPRVGLDKSVPAMIASWEPERIIYVSCYAPTQHRDVRRLAELGYRLESLKLFDFYAQTAHVETVVMMSRGN